MRRRSALAFGFVTAAVCATAFPPLHAQEQADPPPPPNLYTLHVYTNLMQFPTVVLGQDLKPVPPVPREKFAITLDGGPVFHPTKMRIEGDDPISLAVLIDAAGTQSKALQELPQALAQLVPGGLHPQDSVSIYAVDCKLMRTLKDEPATDAETLAKGVTNVLIGPGLHGTKTKAACGYSLHLWDSIGMVAKDMGGPHSRRVLLVVSQGRDTGSKSPFGLVSEELSFAGISLFVLRDGPDFDRERIFTQFGAPMMRGPNIGLNGVNGDDDVLATLCARNGGMVLDSSNPGVAKDLQYLVDLLRKRYILEYPRPDNQTPGMHGVDVKIIGTNDFIRPTGGSSPLADPAILADPNTLPSTPSPAKVGKNRRRDPLS